ncbi:MAG TPA: response regulator [Pyrinomonadaceae bacterium]|nr:response regulator [Pyrinomonadaceae bacterium]
MNPAETRILVVNDIADQLELLRVLLMQSGYRVLTAVDGLEALEIAQSVRPDLIISDVSMPRLDGIELCRRVRQQPALRLVPLLLVSANHRDSAPAASGLKAGADDYLESPYDPDRLVAKVARLLEQKRLEEKLSITNEELRALAAKLQSVREEESIRIAREIHDALGGALTALKMDLASLSRSLSESGDKRIAQKVEAMSDFVDETVHKVRTIATELRPSVLDDLGLVAAIEWQAKEFQKRSGIEVSTTSDQEEVILTADKSTAVFRIFQEILTNVVRHAQATRLEVVIEVKGNNFILRVSDDGIGISEIEIYDPQSLGLLGMRERALICGGQVEINGLKGEGTNVVVSVPIE